MHAWSCDCHMTGYIYHVSDLVPTIIIIGVENSGERKLPDPVTIASNPGSHPACLCLQYEKRSPPIQAIKSWMRERA